MNSPFFFWTMKTNHKTQACVLAILLTLGTQLPFFSLAAYSKFAPGAAVTIGEFVYEDDLTPSFDDCLLTVKNPAGTTVVNAVIMTENADGWHYHTFTPASTSGIWPAVMVCGSGADTVKADKTFEVGLTEVDNDGIAADVWSYGTRTMTSFGSLVSDIWSAGTRSLTTIGSLAADIWSDGFAPTRRLTNGTLTGGGTLSTESFVTTAVDSAESDIIAEVIESQNLINALNDISAADVWAAGTRTLTGSVTVTGDVTLSAAARQAIWDTATSGLTTNGSVGKQVVDNLNATVSSRGTSNLTAADVWAAATRTLTDYSTSSIATAVWANGARTLTNYGNDITAQQVWDVLTTSLNTADSIGSLLATNVDGQISEVLAEVIESQSLINALNDITAAEVWAAGTRTLTGSVTVTGDVTLSAAARQAIWDTATSGLTTSGSVGKQIVDNLNATVSSRGTSNLTAADVWAAGTRTLTDYSTSSIATAVWANAARTLTNYGNDITAQQVWDVLSSSLTTIGSIGAQVATNLDAAVTTRASLTAQQDGWKVMMSDVDRQMATKLYRAKVTVLDYQSSPAASFTVPSITVYDADRNAAVSGAAMTSIATGVYEYTYTIAGGAAQGLWESVVTTQVESGKTVTTNDYWEVTSSPAQVLINSVSDVIVPGIAANITITNEGLTGYEYDYEWCVVTDATNPCGGGNDTYHATAAKFLNPGEDFNTILTATVTTPGNYLFKLVVYFGNDNSRASRTFTAESGVTPPPPPPGGGGGGGGGSTTPPATVACEGSDLNGDDQVNSIDFSILLAFWKTEAPFLNKCVDINVDSQVDSVDFSILLYEWGR